MCKLMEDYADKRANKALVEVALKLWDSGLRDLQQIAKLTDIPLDKVKELFKGKSA